MPQQILCFGEALWDHLPSGRVPGGAPMNVAYHLRLLGCNALVATRVGKDAAGKALVRFLGEKGLASPLIQEDEKLPTCNVEVFHDAGGEARYRIPYPVSWDQIKLSPELLATARTADAVLYGSLACRDAVSRETLLELLAHTQGKKVFDLNIRDPYYEPERIRLLMQLADIVKMNESEYERVCRDLGVELPPEKGLPRLAGIFGCGAVCMTRGAEGAFLWQEGRLFFQPCLPVTVTDTVGAGDAFLAGMLAGLFRDGGAAGALLLGCRMGAHVAGCKGACPDYDPLSLKG